MKIQTEQMANRNDDHFYRAEVTTNARTILRQGNGIRKARVPRARAVPSTTMPPAYWCSTKSSGRRKTPP
jgi:hypothetical protein